MAKIANEIIKCARCGHEHTYPVLLSSSTFGSMDLDTRPSTKGHEQFQYKIQECPKCHYCNTRVDVVEGALQDFSLEYKELLCNSDISPVAKKYMMAAILQEKVENFCLAGELYLMAAWIFDDEENTELAINVRKASAKNIRKDVELSNDCETAIMLVDILRRAGEFQESLAMIAFIGDTGDEYLNSILRYETALINRQDLSCHSVEEM